MKRKTKLSNECTRITKPYYVSLDIPYHGYIAVAKFVKDEIQPHVKKMDEDSHMPDFILEALFKNGVSLQFHVNYNVQVFYFTPTPPKGRHQGFVISSVCLFTYLKRLGAYFHTRCVYP